MSGTKTVSEASLRKGVKLLLVAWLATLAAAVVLSLQAQASTPPSDQDLEWCKRKLTDWRCEWR